MQDDTPVSDRILVVDDSEDSRRLIALIFRKAGYEVVEAISGEEALEKVVALAPDLILLDILMPGIDGFEVCRQLKADEATGEIPVIFMSALEEARDKIRGLELGGADYITKPFNRGEALARVRNHLTLRRLTREVQEANRRLRENQERLEGDLRAAAGIQLSLLPRTLPASNRLQMAWKFLPSETISGDIFNVFFLDPEHLGFYMLDVSGHGVPSALVTVSVSQMLQPHGNGILRQPATAPPYYRLPPPDEILRRLDQDYPLERFDKYFTIFYGIVHLDSDELAYSSAGHPPPVLLRQSGETELLTEGGPIIGLGLDTPFDTGSRKLAPGDKLLLYTDGVLERENGGHHFYGMERFLNTLESVRRQEIPVLLDRVVEDIEAFSGGVRRQDDVTLLGIGFRSDPQNNRRG